MATRKEIKQNFRDELVNAVDGLVPAENVTLRYVQHQESLPAVAYRESFVLVPINDASANPERIEYDNNGHVVGEYYHEYNEARISVFVIGQTAEETEDIYEAVHTAFHKYSLGAWDKKDFHEDLFDFGIRVESGRPYDQQDDERTIRGELLTVVIRFYREYELTGDNITSVEADVVDDDEAIWFEYTIE